MIDLTDLTPLERDTLLMALEKMMANVGRCDGVPPHPRGLPWPTDRHLTTARELWHEIHGAGVRR